MTFRYLIAAVGVVAAILGIGVSVAPAANAFFERSRTDRYRGGLPLIHSLNGFRLHQTAMYLESQTQFGDILRPREGSAGTFLDPTQPVADRVRVASKHLSRTAHRRIIVLPHPKRFKKHLPLLVGKIAKTVQRAPTVWIIAARRVLLPAPDRTLIMGVADGI